MSELQIKFHEGYRLRWTVDEATDCHIWPGSLSDKGYGLVSTSKGGTRRAHIVCYESVKGKVPAGKMLDHTCRNRRCINPAHLEPVTNQVNTQRGLAAKLDHTKIEEIKEMRRLNITWSAISRMFSISRRQAVRVVTGECWGVKQ